MKRFIIAIAAAALVCAGAFAQDNPLATAEESAKAAVAEQRDEHAQSLQGIWYDKKYDANWVFTLNTDKDSLCTLEDASTGSVYYRFTKNNIQNWKVEMTTNGAVFSWDCKAKNRQYRFTKPIHATKDLDLDIYNTYYKESHRTTLTFKDLLAN